VKLHLESGGMIWCDEHQDHESITEDPRDATCGECLKCAASFGAAAAMRYAAVEAGATQDPELVKERDVAIEKLNMLTVELEAQHIFFCVGCSKLKATDVRNLRVGSMSWCGGCAPSRWTHPDAR